MMDEPAVPDVRALWQNQSGEEGGMSLAEVRRKSRELHAAASRRVLWIYLMGAGNAGLPLVLMWFVPGLRLGLAYLAATALVLVLFVRRRSAVRILPPDATASQGLAFYRHLLERERDYRRDSARWFTIGPGVNIIVLGLAYISSPLFHATMLEFSFIVALALTHVVLLIRVARRLGGEARRYQLELDGLPAAITGP